jgi:Chaperone of endosialidase
MKTFHLLRKGAFGALLLAAGLLQTAAARAQGTAFTYQGRLNNSSGPATGTYDFAFTLFHTNVDGTAFYGTVTNAAVPVANGLFTVNMDFGGTPYVSGQPLWLEIAVRTNGADGFATLSPRQPVLSAPYAAYAYAVDTASLIGQVTDEHLSTTLSWARLFSNPGNVFFGDGSHLTGINASQYTGMINDGQLSANIARRDEPNTFIGDQTITSGGVILHGDKGHGFLQDDGTRRIGTFTDNTGAGYGTITPDPLHLFVADQIGLGIVINTNGNVGIGTQSPSTALAVSGTVTATAFAGDGSQLTGVSASQFTGPVADGQLSDNVALRNGGNTFTGTQKLVGPTQPDSYFGLLLEDANHTGDLWLLTKWDAAGNKRFSLYDGNGVAPLVFQEHGGNVGIGTLSPSTALEVKGTATATAFAGDGSLLTGVNAAKFTGPVGDGQLSDNVALRNGGNTYTGTQKIVGPTQPGSYFGLLLEDAGFTGDLWLLTIFDKLGNKRFSLYDGNGVTPLVLQERGGNVGIGTLSPSTALEVKGTATATAFAGDGSLLTGVNAAKFTGPVGDGQLSGNVALRSAPNAFTGDQTIAAGKLGIGTTTPLAELFVNALQYGAKPVGVFEVANCGGVCGQTDYQENIRLVNSNPNGQTGIGFLTLASPTNNVTDTVPNAWIGTHYGATTTANSLKFSTRKDGALVERMWIDGDNGNVGIGTRSPSTALAVNGTVTATSFVGDGSKLTGVNATQFSGLVSDGQLSDNVARRDGPNTFTGDQTIQSGGVILHDVKGYGFLQDDGTHRVGTFAGPTGAGFGTITHDPLHLFVSDQIGLGMVITTNGFVGIGTQTPAAGLEVETTASVSNGAWSFFQKGTVNTGSLSGSPTVAIYTAGAMGASTYYAFSDARIKDIAGVSAGDQDLKTLRAIEVTDYTYKDKVANGGRPVKKVIAQQVESVYPQAVSRTTGVVPDIYKQATYKDGWIELATDLKTGERVKLFASGGQGVYPVLEVRNGAFRTDFAPRGNEVFVFGREVADFRNVDYEALAMLNVSATQELARRLEAEQAVVARLKDQLAATVAEKDALLKHLVALEARDQAREDRLIKLEGALNRVAGKADYASLQR